VNNCFPSALALAVLFASSPAAAAQDLITVDVATVLADVSRKPIGINVNFLLDDDANRAAAIQSLADALKQAGVRYLRYPGGEKSDAYLWSVAPFTSSVPTLARWAAGEYPQNQEWPSYDRNLVESDGRTFKSAPLDFDEFMTVCRAIDCIPTIVVCYDSMYKAAQAVGVAPTREQLLQTAREWVRYANITKNYGVKYWELGNESYLPHYNGSATAADYARDLIEFSRVMKAVDPTILIGANGESTSWWQTILATAAAAVDFLAVHNYPSSSWNAYGSYQNSTVNLMGTVQTAQQAINTYAPAADRNRLVIAATETNSAAWSGTWPHVNDLGHALVLFDIFGAHLSNPKVAFAQLWNTRWSGNDTATTPALWDALDKRNQLQATGRATAIWGQFLKEKLVSSSSTAKIRSYSTHSPSSGKLSVFLINKDTLAHSTSVTINGSGGDFTVDTWVFSGDGAEDLQPTWARHGEGSKAGNRIAITLAPVSITILDLTPEGMVHSAPGVIQAEDFRDDAYWDSTAGNAGSVYRATDVDIQPTSDSGGGFNIAWITAGEWLEFTIRVQTAGLYDLSARVASPYSGTSLRFLVNGQDLSGAVAVPVTGGWQKWQTVTRTSVYLPAGTHRARVSAITNGFNLNWMSLSAAAGLTHTVPGRIQAEDFREDGYWDSTPGNYGTAYRATDVDVEPSSDAGAGFDVGWIAAGEWLEYEIRVPAAGFYDLSARVASPNSGKSFAVLVDGAGVNAAITVPNTGSWQTWQTVTRPKIYLPAGTHRARAEATTAGFNLNWISFTASSGTTHAVPGIIQAEDFIDGAYWDSTTGNLGNAYRASDVDLQATTDTGGGFNVAWMASGEWQEYTIQVPAAGYYDLSARVASPYTGKSFRVLLNGSDVTGSLSVPNTGGYQTWRTVTRSRIYLASGAHRLRSVAITNGFNLNWLSLHKSP
jgi:alpha-N-arabinofuranosidase